uniref:alpha-amylase n=1 Tax=Anopheles atroparvus TaxID=41427 RepID=A0AAG5DJK7_ANOAO
MTQLVDRSGQSRSSRGCTMFVSVRTVAIGVVVISLVAGNFEPHFEEGRDVIVQLFEWRFEDIARECREYLGPNGFGGVQLAPVNEVRDGGSWADRYEPVSYRLLSRSGNEPALRSMVDTCNEAGVRVYVEVVLNHMARTPSNQETGSIRGTGGSIANPGARDYPGVPYSAEDFTAPCQLTNPCDAHALRNCWKENRPDLNLGLSRVRQRIVDFLNRLLAIGVAGFFIDSALYMWPHDLRAIYEQLHNLSTAGGIFPPRTRPFICLDLSYHGSGIKDVSWTEYAALGRIAHNRFAYDIGDVLLKRKPFHYFVNLGTRLGYIPREKALVYASSPQLQRLTDADGDLRIVSVKNRRAYQIAMAFMLAHRYGLARVTSSYEFNAPYEGPPSDAQGNIIPVELDDEGSCRKPWICEHRWPVVQKMVRFRAAAHGADVVSWVDNGQNQIAFCRDRIGFVAFNAENSLILKTNVYTCLGEGLYCDLISGEATPVNPEGDCTGTSVAVDEEGRANVFIRGNLNEPFLALLASTRSN